MTKNTLVLLASALVFSSAFAQDSGSKKFRLGLKGVSSMNWYRPDDAKIKNNGAALGWGWGLITEFGITENAAFYTGLQFDYDRGKLRYESGDTSNYKLAGANYYFLDPNFVAIKNMEKDTVGKNFDTLKLVEREYRVNYITLPAVLKMKTKEIGHFTYFGQFGFIFSFKTSAVANDKVNFYSKSGEYEKSKVDVSTDVNLFRLQLSVGGGAEWNLAGSTSLVFGINYNRGFTNVLAGGFSNKSNHLFMLDKSNPANVIPFSQKAFADNFALTVGILF